MNIEILKYGTKHYRADCVDLPGSPSVGIGKTPEKALIHLLLILLHNKEYHFRELSIDDQSQVLNLFKECEDYFYLVEGKVADDKNAKEFFEELPPNKGLEDKNLYVYGKKVDF